MKPKLYSLLLPPTLAASSYNREGPNCHHNIIFKNSSSDTIIYALKGSNGSGLCTLVFTPTRTRTKTLFWTYQDTVGSKN